MLFLLTKTVHHLVQVKWISINKYDMTKTFIKALTMANK